MPDPMLFPFLDTAVRVIAVLVLCAIPVLIPLPSINRSPRGRVARTSSSKPALTPD